MSEKTTERCVEFLDQGYLCAEAVLLSVAEGKGIHSDLIPKIATGFSAGMARGEACVGP